MTSLLMADTATLETIIVAGEEREKATLIDVELDDNGHGEFVIIHGVRYFRDEFTQEGGTLVLEENDYRVSLKPVGDRFAARVEYLYL